ncbi:hypothetical protein ACP275_05G104300 [Erythranthe tilingii]
MDLPTDLLQEIFTRLPCKDIVSCKCVCTSWYNLLSHPDFTRSYTINSPFTTVLLEQASIQTNSIAALQFSPTGEIIPTPLTLTVTGDPGGYLSSTVHLVGAANGLLFLLLVVCFSDRVTEKIFFSNPLTGESVGVAENNLLRPEEWWYGYEYKIGYVRGIDKYKIVRFSYHDHDKLSQAKVFTVGVDLEWRTIVVEDDQLFDFLFRRSNGVSFRGFYHWIPKNDNNNNNNNRICTFDFSEEKCGSGIPKPLEFKPVSNHKNTNLRVLNNDRLSLIDVSVWGEITIWTMEKYGVADSWSKNVILCSLIRGLPRSTTTRNNEYNIITKLPNGNVVLSPKGGDKKTFISINTEKQRSTRVDVLDFGNNLRYNSMFATAFAPRFYRLKEDTSGVLHRKSNRNTASSRVDVPKYSVVSRFLSALKRCLRFVFKLFK